MSRRFLEIDVLKLLGIVTVVLIHAAGPPWGEVPPLELWLGHLTRFAVPGFLFASGFLYATREPIPWTTTGRRLRRIGVPYLLASLGAQLWWSWRGEPSPGGSLALDLLFGSSFGPYYYVFVIAGLVIAAVGFARLPGSLVAAGTLALVAAQWWVDAAAGLPLPFYWHLRNPLLWWGYFAVGWWLRLHHERIGAWLSGRRAPLGALGLLALALLTAILALPGPLLLVRSAAWLHVWMLIATVVVLAGGERRVPAPIARASDATYAVYLFHLFFVYGAQLWAPAPRGELAGLTLWWAAGLLGSALLVWSGRRLLGARSRDWIGA